MHNTQFTLSLPGRKPDYQRMVKALETKDWRQLRLMGAKYYDWVHKQWFTFRDDFDMAKWAAGILQEEPPKTEPIGKIQEGQGNLFEL